MLMEYFCSDHHLGHTNILEYCPGRKELWSNVDEMNQDLIDRHNAKVKKDKDTTFILGDVLFNISFDILDKMRGKKILILGNHDNEKQCRESGKFESIHHYLEIKRNKKKIVLCHYKFSCWNGSHYPNGRHYYGHSHGTRPGDNQCCDVGVDVPFTNFSPVNFDEIEDFLQTQPERKKEF